MGESMDLGNTFWQADFGKNEKNDLDRGFIKPSTEVYSPQPRFYQALDRGFFQPSVEVFINPRSRFHTSTEGFKIPRPRVYKYLDRGTSVQ